MKKSLFLLLAVSLLIGCCKQTEQKNKYVMDRFYDLEILRYDVPDFESLTLQQKTLIYYLNEAAQEGRDILFDQNGKYNLCIRRTLESIYQNYPDKKDEQFLLMEKYLKRVWFSNGIHHHYNEDKFLPEFTREWFFNALDCIPEQEREALAGDINSPLLGNLSNLIPIMFEPNIMPKKTNQADGVDLILTSANNYYEGVTQAEAEEYYNTHKDTSAEPLWIGLNAKLVKKDGVVQEQTYKVGGLYGEALEKVNFWLRKALEVAENEQQRLVIQKLIDYNQTGDLKTFNEYAIAWVKDVDSRVDFVNGFTEVYGDPLGITGAWESLVNFKNLEATKRTEILAENAQWFENNSPTAKEYKKEQVKGITAKVINATMLAGNCYPSTPIGINLPNANWIRKEYGSKSVTIQNITDAYDKAAQGNGFAEEFMLSQKEIETTLRVQTPIPGQTYHWTPISNWNMSYAHQNPNDSSIVTYSCTSALQGEYPIYVSASGLGDCSLSSSKEYSIKVDTIEWEIAYQYSWWSKKFEFLLIYQGSVPDELITANWYANNESTYTTTDMLPLSQLPQALRAEFTIGGCDYSIPLPNSGMAAPKKRLNQLE
ncbi:MAG: hypothetical protein IJ756_05390, partial [Paludibacteraceae bacterium]|nr:hypothetical protein [Paludibacteraceae bacterium]